MYAGYGSSHLVALFRTRRESGDEGRRGHGRGGQAEGRHQPPRLTGGRGGKPEQCSGRRDGLERDGKEVGARVDGVLGSNYLQAFVVTIDYARHVLRLRQGAETTDNISRPFSAGIPFILASSLEPLILVRAIVNESEPSVFALDTGASTTIVSHVLADRLGIKREPTSTLTTAGGYRVNASVGSTKTFAVGTARLDHLPIIVADFLEAVSEVIRTRIDGIIGYNYLKQFVVTIDYPHQLLHLEQPP